MTRSISQFSESPVAGFGQRFTVDASAAYAAPTGTRLNARFMRAGADALPDDELLELCLQRSVPHRKLRPLVDQLLGKFGDFNHVMAASPAQLTNIAGLGAEVIQDLKIVEASAHRMAQARILQTDVISSWDSLIRYCKTRMAHLQTEQFRVLFLNRKNVLIADEAQSGGTVDHVPVYPREILKRALELNASALILIHNHPSGDPTPSDADIAMTKKIAEGANALSLILHDHIIVGKSDVYSFRSVGHIRDETGSI